MLVSSRPSLALLFAIFVAYLAGRSHAQIFSNTCVNLGDTTFVGTFIGCEGGPTFGVPCTAENWLCSSCECLGLKTPADPIAQALAEAGVSSAIGVRAFAAAAVAVGIAAVM